MDVTQRKITKIAREVSKFTVRTLHEQGVGASELDLIHAVRHKPGITQKGICDILGQDKAAVARQTASLEKKGYLTRVQNPSDGRSRLIYPTEKAQELKNSKAGIETAFYRWLCREFTDRERQTFAALLDRLYVKCKNERRANFANVEKFFEEEYYGEIKSE